jgi:hypothetical protein
MVALAEFFESETVGLPKAGPQDDVAFDSFIEGIFAEYISLVGTIDDPAHPSLSATIRKELPQIEYLAKEIIRSTKAYLDGHPHLAYSILADLLGYLQIQALFTTLTRYQIDVAARSVADTVLNSALHPPLYRVRSDRAAASNGELSRKDMFHVPFEKRRLVRNQRYSIAGLPCLYLGSSIWICWEEMGRPSLDSLSISRFRIAEPVVVLDFQYAPNLAWRVFKWMNGPLPDHLGPERIQAGKSRYSEIYISSYAIFWPLVAACSIKVSDRAVHSILNILCRSCYFGG